MTKQEAFDASVRVITAQGKKSINKDNGCAYRGHDGLVCNVGALLADEEYTRRMDGKTVTQLNAEGLLPARLQGIAGFLSELQLAHDELWVTHDGELDEVPDDREFLINFHEKCAELAAKYNLDTTELDRCRAQQEENNEARHHRHRPGRMHRDFAPDARSRDLLRPGADTEGLRDPERHAPADA